MRVSRCRLTVQRMLVIIAIVAAILGLQEERRSRFKRVSLAHERAWKDMEVSDLELYLLLGPYQGASVEFEEARAKEVEPLKTFCIYQGNMAAKYAIASENPLLPVCLDPPPPPKPSKEYVKSLFTRYLISYSYE